MRARRLQRPNPGFPSAPFLRDWSGNRGEGPCVFDKLNKRSLRATRPLMKTRDSFTPFEMTFCKWFDKTGKDSSYPITRFIHALTSTAALI